MKTFILLATALLCFAGRPSTVFDHEEVEVSSTITGYSRIAGVEYGIDFQNHIYVGFDMLHEPGDNPAIVGAEVSTYVEYLDGTNEGHFQYYPVSGSYITTVSQSMIAFQPTHGGGIKFIEFYYYIFYSDGTYEEKKVTWFYS